METYAVGHIIDEEHKEAAVLEEKSLCPRKVDTSVQGGLKFCEWPPAFQWHHKHRNRRALDLESFCEFGRLDLRRR
jgi:hypothetical protein